MDPFGGMRRNATEHIGEPQLGIDVVFLAGRQERVDDGRALSGVVRAGKQIILAFMSSLT